MAPESDPVELEMSLVLEAIERRYGYDLRGYMPDSMQRRLRAALARSGLAHFGELQHRLLHDPAWFAILLDQLTVQVSDMFRDPAFYRAFRERVAPLLRTYPTLKIWHAGCSRGEEVYATAIVLEEEDLYDRAQIYATDLSAKALGHAKEGVYDQKDVGRFAESYAQSGGTRRLSDYYSAAYERIAMRESLKRNMVFFQHNLLEDYAIGEMNVIFCRNVLFYFERSLRQRVLGMLAQGLRHGGFLCLGATETLPDTALGSFGEFARNERIYRRVEAV
jgi:chemotaxis protein methyltransferase CheR